MEAAQKRKEVVQYLIKNKVLVTGELLSLLQQESAVDAAHTHIQTEQPQIGAFLEHLRSGPRPAPSTTASLKIQPNVVVLDEYRGKPQKASVQNFIGLFNARYKAIEGMLRHRTEFKYVTSIARMGSLEDQAQVSVIGMVLDKYETKNGHLSLTIEDPTGTINVIVTKNDPKLFAAGQDVMLDEVLGITGRLNKTDPKRKCIFPTAILYPDIPMGREYKKAPDEAYAAFISDFHIGSKLFTEKSFNHFIEWICGNAGDDKYREIARKTKYLFIIGDLVDSVGVYPSQEHELVIKDVYKQFEKAHSFLSRIPRDVNLIICPGNHEPMRIAEPQPRIDRDFGKLIWELPNATIVTNPAMVRIHSSQQFPGFDVLMYHGFSYTYYGDQVHSIRTSGKNVSERIELIMKYVLQRRHFAPTYGSTQFIAEPTHDPLVVTAIPDIFCSGHIHKSSISDYKGVQVISGSCFQRMSSYQEKFGHVPDPGKVPIINLQTRQGTVMDFNVEDQ